MNNQVFDKPSSGASKNQVKIVFFGTSEFAVPALKSLINFGYNITSVVTQPEKPVGRARVIMPSPVKKTALENHLEVLEPHNLKSDDEIFIKFKSLNPDLCIVAAYGKIIPLKYLEIPKYGFINIHPSFLPKYRGPSPIQTAILNGDIETGVTIIKIDEQMDHGPILAQREWEIPNPKSQIPNKSQFLNFKNSKPNYQELHDFLSKEGAELLIDTLPKYLSGEVKPLEQEHSKATYTKKFERTDGRINWSKTAEEIYNQIRALNPEPGTWTKYKDKILNIKTSEILNLEAKLPSPGIVTKINDNVAVGTQKCYLILKRIQLEGGKEMDANSFLNGHPEFIGSQLG